MVGVWPPKDMMVVELLLQSVYEGCALGKKAVCLAGRLWWL